MEKHTKNEGIKVKFFPVLLLLLRQDIQCTCMGPDCRDHGGILRAATMGRLGCVHRLVRTAYRYGMALNFTDEVGQLKYY